MGSALLYYLAQTWTADRYWQAQHDAPARHSRPSPRAHRGRGLPAVVARRLRTVLGGGSP
jgi:hypothetical protein